MASGFNFQAASQNTGQPQAFNFSAHAPVVQHIQGVAPNAAATASPAAPAAPKQDGASVSRFEAMYKTKSRAEQSQKMRVYESLQKQKERRIDFMSHVRKIADVFVDDEDDEEKQEEIHTLEMRKNMGDETAKDILNAIEERRKKAEERKSEVWRFRNQLMHSEWLLEKPDDFEEKWVMVPIPQGKRNLVISSGGQTSAYSKSGMCISRFSSHLPGGGKHKHKWNMETSVLDCVYNEVTKTYYIIDMMSWRQTPMYDTETQFRFYWMHEKFLEVPEVAKITKQNPYRFEPLPNFRCQPENLTTVLGCPMSVPMDGLLFYHKEGHYTFGFTPLVLWIRPYMVPEGLGIMVPQKFIDRAPPDYKGFAKHKEQCLKNMELRDENDKKRTQARYEKKHEKRAQKLLSEGKDISHLKSSFVSAGQLKGLGAENMET